MLATPTFGGISKRLHEPEVRYFLNGPQVTYSQGQSLPLASEDARIVRRGWVLAERRLPRGIVQTIRIYQPGDLLDDSDGAWTDLVAACAVTITRVPPAIRGSASFKVYVDADEKTKVRQMIEHMVRLGRLPALQRMAQWLLEIDARYRSANPGTNDAISLPLTQTHMANYLALSPVHINRTLMFLRREAVLEIRPAFRVLDRARLKDIASWTSTDPAKREPQLAEISTRKAHGVQLSA
jgi:CRP-like cAMP-binding protein